MSKKSAAGSGTIRKKTVTRSGKQYTYWEARVTTGTDPGTGKQFRRSISGKTQKEVRQKMAQVTAAVDNGTYKQPCKMTVGEWLDIWKDTYLFSVKPRTKESYCQHIKNHIKPAMGAVKLEALNAHTVQSFYNSLTDEKELSPKTVKNIHGVFHKAMSQAVVLGYIRQNPADACSLPKVERVKIKPLDSAAIGAFLKAIQGHRYEALYMVTLFTGMRRGEVCGLKWDCVDFEHGTILIDKQLQKIPGERAAFRVITTKSGKERTITAAASVMEVLKQQRADQAKMRLKAGAVWEDSGFVFTDEIGRHLSPHTVYHNFKRIMETIGMPDARFHDLRHSYAVAALKSGDDLKTVQGNLGHATASFTLDVYGHVTEEMKQASADRMERFIQSVSCS